MHVHADIDVRYKVAACEALKLLTLLERVHGSDNYVGGLQLISRGVPTIAKRDYPRTRLKAADEPFGDARLRKLGSDVGQRTANEAVGVGFVNRLGIHVDISAYSHMSGLLHHVRATAAKTDNAYGSSLQGRVAVRSEETLAIKPAHVVHHLRRGTPTSMKEAMK